MKTKLFFLAIGIAILTISLIVKPDTNIINGTVSKTENTVYDIIPFILGVYNNGEETIDNNSQNRKIFTDILNLNLWHKFSERKGGSGKRDYQINQGWTSEDALYYPDGTNNLINSVTNILEANGSSLRTLMQRPKTEWLFFAQRSDYQCVDRNFLANPDFWFYTYSFPEHKGTDITDNSNYGNGVKVRYCRAAYPDGRDSGYVVKNLISNREQINTGNPGHGYPYPGFGDGQFAWYVKPRIRIDPSFAANSANNDIKVCRIEVFNYEGDKIGGRDIKVKNFIDGNTLLYNGNYLETYFDYQTDTANMIIPSGWKFNPNDRNWVTRNKTCKVDFRVYWYGKCDMWINYVRVDDDRANRLFKDGGDAEYEAMIQMEARHANYNNSPLMFYIDEFEFNHIPAITYVMKKLQQYGGSDKPPFVLATNNTAGPGQWYELHLPPGDTLSLSHFKRYCLDSCKIALYGFSNTYPFTAKSNNNSSYIPSTLPITSSPYNYADVVSPVLYENWLQVHIDKEGFIDDCKKLQYIASLKSGLNTFFSIQAYSEIHTDITNGNTGTRETTNEEINMMVNTALSYGSKGIIYYWWGGFGESANGSVDKEGFSISLANRLGNSASLTPRYLNFFGQEKWKFIVQINNILKKLAPTLIKFSSGDTKSFIYRTERSDLITNTYFADVFTYKPDIKNVNIPSINPESLNERYLQVGTFRNPDEQNSRYFMIVNRRCSPFYDKNGEYGGGRYISVQFNSNSSEINQFNNWKIYNVENDSLLLTFNIRNNPVVDLSWFMPGEGKLFKLVPAM
ncbi:MAG TPA: hypothetical protein VIL99_10100 [Ignavibacteria bacterium]